MGQEVMVADVGRRAGRFAFSERFVSDLKRWSLQAFLEPIYRRRILVSVERLAQYSDDSAEAEEERAE